MIKIFSRLDPNMIILKCPDLDTLRGANLRGANLRGTNLGWTNLSGADLRGANLREANLSGADLSGADLSGADLRRADLHKADLRGANLRGADLDGANLSGADLSGADLSGADLRRADLHKADLREANLSGADLDGADLSGADLSGADLGDRSIPIVPKIDRRILEAIEGGDGSLEMNVWHTCATTHCRAGWAIHLAGEAGYALEAKIGPCAAGAFIYSASRPTRRVPDFYATNQEALDDLRRSVEACEEVDG